MTLKLKGYLGRMRIKSIKCCHKTTDIPKQYASKKFADLHPEKVEK